MKGLLEMMDNSRCSLVEFITEAVTKDDLANSAVIRNLNKYVTNTRKLVIYLSNTCQKPIKRTDRHGKEISQEQFDKMFKEAIDEMSKLRCLMTKTLSKYKPLEFNDYVKLYNEPTEIKSIDLVTDDKKNTFNIEFRLKGKIVSKSLYYLNSDETDLKKTLDSVTKDDLEEDNVFHYYNLDD